MPAADPPAATPTHRRPLVAGVLVGLAIALTAALSLGIVAVAIEEVLLDDLRNYLRRTAETTAAMIDGDRHATFTDSAQTDTPDYLAASAPLAALLEANPDIRFAYTGSFLGDSMFFVLDGDRTADRAWVGQPDESTPGEREVARSGKTVVERRPSPTVWGVGIRAYAPIMNRAGYTGAWVGITMSAERYDSWIQRVYHTAAVGFLVALVLAVLAGSKAAAVERTRQRAEAEIVEARELAAAAAEDRRLMERRFHSQQKMEALGTLAGGVAHDFNNLLAVILGNAEIISAEVAPESTSGESVTAIKTAAMRARDVVKRILLFARPEAESRKSIALGPVIDETVHLLSATMPSSITIAWQRPTQPVIATADDSQVTQVLMNLGVNAGQALPDDRGTIEFQLDQVELAGAEAERLGLRPGPYARVVVRDTGIGMSDSVRGRIFEPFFTTKPVGKGSGLGLAVVEGVVRGHRGGIDVQSEEGRGSAFSIYLPASATVSPVATAADSTPRPAPEGRGQRILLVDDDPMVLDVGAKMMRRAGYAVDSHPDPLEALAVLASNPEAYAVLVTDRTMPKLTGLEVASRARELNPRLPVVLLTGKAQPGDSDAPQISAVVNKPADAKALLGTIERVIAESRPSAASR
jgi:signal transduction histidine kinase/ActR/RegA family two-component response regulator